ncbi:hypothetical protein DX933_03395 [Ornithinibacillus gellani]|nr:hypothetical protein DX933_03395 [Ornithinibacillus gellani]
MMTRLVCGGSTASKGLIGSTNNQWGRAKNPHRLKFHFMIVSKAISIISWKVVCLSFAVVSSPVII